MSQQIDVRCPSGPRNLLMQLQADPDNPPHVDNGLLVLMCRDCTRKHRKEMERVGLPTNFRVVHTFDFAGRFVESLRKPLS